MTNARSSEFRFECDLSGVRAGRHFVSDALTRWGLPTLLDDASLGVSELIANAVRHAGTEFAVRIDVAEKVIVTVVDGSSELGTTAAEDSKSGRGMTIVATISEDWGVTPLEDGKAIWFSLPLPDANSVDADLVNLADRRAAASDRYESAPAVAYEVRSAV